MVHVIGVCKIKEKLSARSLTTYAGGDASAIAGKTLRVVCTNTAGDYLCLNEDGTALADVDKEDVEGFTRYYVSVPADTKPMMELFAPLKEACHEREGTQK